MKSHWWHGARQQEVIAVLYQWPIHILTTVSAMLCWQAGFWVKEGEERIFCWVPSTSACLKM